MKLSYIYIDPLGKAPSWATKGQATEANKYKYNNKSKKYFKLLPLGKIKELLGRETMYCLNIVLSCLFYVYPPKGLGRMNSEKKNLKN